MEGKNDMPVLRVLLVEVSCELSSGVVNGVIGETETGFWVENHTQTRLSPHRVRLEGITVRNKWVTVRVNGLF